MLNQLSTTEQFNILKNAFGIVFLTTHNYQTISSIYSTLLLEKNNLLTKISQTNERIHLTEDELKLLLLNNPYSESTKYQEYLSYQELCIIKSLLKVASYKAETLTEEELLNLREFFGKGSSWQEIYNNFPKGLEIPVSKIPLVLSLLNKQLTANYNINLYQDLVNTYMLTPTSDKILALQIE